VCVCFYVITVIVWLCVCMLQVAEWHVHDDCVQPMEVYVDDDSKLTLHGLQQHYCKLKDNEKNRKLFDLLDALEFNQVRFIVQ
jgi:hypothetical protein